MRFQLGIVKTRGIRLTRKWRRGWRGLFSRRRYQGGYCLAILTRTVYKTIMTNEQRTNGR